MTLLRIAPFTFEVLHDSLYAVAAEMGAHLVKIAYSTIVRESHDCATGVTDARGRVVAQAPYTPGHFNSIPPATKGMLKEYPADKLRPGDVLVTNDPWICAGHLPDIFVFTPFFYRGELLAVLATVAHHVDVGGKNPGGTTPNTSHLYEEGLQLPVVKLYDEGHLNEAVVRIVRQNVRLPDMVATDLQAQVAVNARGAARLHELCEKYGRDAFLWTCEEALARSEALTRDAFSRIPDGTYGWQEYVDDDGWTDDLIPIRVAITVKGSDLYVDYTGSGAQTRGGINVTPSYRDAYTHMIIRCFTDPHIPHNEGCFAPIHVYAPEGSILNPRYPAAVAGRGCVIPRLADVVTASMSQAVPERAMAGYGGMLGQPVYSGTDPRNGRRFIFFDNSHGGTGGRRGRDGVDCVSWPWNGGNHSIEVLETIAPIEIFRYELYQDSDGAGTWRGGLGVIKDYKMHTGPVNVQLGADRFKLPSFGLEGGGESIPEAFVLVRDGEETPLRSKGEYHLNAGEVLSVRMPGGGGLGPAWARDPQLVLRDVTMGYISAQRARDAYGVALTPDGSAVDDVTTTQLRAAMRAAASTSEEKKR